MRILITGGAGFVGSNLAVELRRISPSSTITCMDNLYRRGSEMTLRRLQEHSICFHWGDIRDAESFPGGGFDFLIECSAEPSVLAGVDGSPEYVFQTNLMGAFRCLEFARRHSIRLLFLSSSRVYPIARLDAHPWREEETRFAWEDVGTPGISSRGVGESVDMSGARSLYGYTKLAAEQLIEEYRAAYGLRAVVNRCGVIAGPWQFGKVDQGVISLWVLAHRRKQPLRYLGYGGTGKQVRDVLHVDDLCELIIEQIFHFDAWEGWAGNVSGGAENSLSLLELTKLCREVTGETVPIERVPTTRQNDLRIFVADCSTLHQRTAWRPMRQPRRIIADIAEWAAKAPIPFNS